MCINLLKIVSEHFSNGPLVMYI